MTAVWATTGAIAAAYVLLIAALLWRRRRLRAEVAASARWTAVPSRVVASELRTIVAVKGGSTFVPMVTYDYAVGERTLRSERLHFGDPVGFSFRRRAERRLAVLRAAAATQAYHDPADPTRSVIERSAPVLRRDLVLLVLLAVVLAGFLAVVRAIVPV